MKKKQIISLILLGIFVFSMVSVISPAKAWHWGGFGYTRVYGYVTDANTGSPISGVTVTLIGSGTFSVDTTDANGRFDTYTDLFSGSIYVTLKYAKSGYTTNTISFSVTPGNRIKSTSLTPAIPSQTYSFEGNIWTKQIRSRGSTSSTSYYNSEYSKVKWSTNLGVNTAEEWTATYLRYVGFSTTHTALSDTIIVNFDGAVQSGHSSPRRMYVGIFDSSWNRVGNLQSLTNINLESKSFSFSGVTPGQSYNVFFFYSDAWSYDWNTKISVSLVDIDSFWYVNFDFSDPNAMFAGLKDLAEAVIDQAIPVGTKITVGPYSVATAKGGGTIHFELERYATNSVRISLIDSKVKFPTPYAVIDIEVPISFVVEVTVQTNSVVVVVKELEVGVEVVVSADITTILGKIIDKEFENDPGAKSAASNAVANANTWGLFDGLPKIEAAAGIKLSVYGAQTTITAEPGEKWTGNLQIDKIVIETYLRGEAYLGVAVKTDALRDAIVDVLNNIPDEIFVGWNGYGFDVPLSSFRDAATDVIKAAFDTAGFSVDAKFDGDFWLTRWLVENYDILSSSRYAKLYVGRLLWNLETHLSYSINLDVGFSVSTPGWLRFLGAPDSLGASFHLSESANVFDYNGNYDSGWFIDGTTISP